MEDIHKKVIKAVCKRLVYDLHATGEIRECFIEKGLFSEFVLEEIEAGRTSTDKNRLILKHLLRSGPDAYITFLQCLKDSHHSHLVDIMVQKETEIRENFGQTPDSSPTDDDQTFLKNLESEFELIYRKPIQATPDSLPYEKGVGAAYSSYTTDEVDGFAKIIPIKQVPLTSTPKVSKQRPPFSYTEADVRKLKWGDASKLCEKYGIDCENFESLGDFKEALLEYLEEDEVDENDTSEDFEIQELIKAMLSNDASVRKRLNSIYERVIRLVSGKDFDKDIKYELKLRCGRDGDFLSLLQHYHEQLYNKECYIVVTGETSAGKSSFLNLLLGTDILPTSHIRCSSVILQIHNSGETDPRIVLSGKEVESMEIKVNSREELKTALEPYTTFEKTSDTPLYSLIDIYWPIEMLHENVSLVDTPGIGDTEELTSTVIEYLRNAIAYIYIINSGNAAGVQQDRILRILKEQSKWRKGGDLNTFDPKLAVFVCNKWDQVQDSEKATVWNYTTGILKNSWPGLMESQMIQLSVLKEMKRMQSQRKISKDFRNLILYIKKMVPSSLQANITRHAVRLEEFLNQIMHSATTKINVSRKSKEEKDQYLSQMSRELNSFTKNVKQMEISVISTIDKKENQCAELLHIFLRQPEMVEKLCSWKVEECPPYSTVQHRNIIEDRFKETRKAAQVLISNRVKGEILNWMTENENLFDMQENVEGLQSYLNKETETFHYHMETLSSICVKKNLDQMSERNRFNLGVVFSGAGFGVSSLGLGCVHLALEACTLIFLTSSMIMGIAALSLAALGMLLFRKRYTEKDYKKEIPELMSKWTLAAVDALSLPLLRECFAEAIFTKCRRWVVQQCETSDQIRITDHYILRQIQHEERSADVVYKTLEPIKTEAQKCWNEINLLMRLHYSETTISPTLIKNMADDTVADSSHLIGNGTFGQSSKVKLLREGMWINAVMKTASKPPEDELVAILMSEDISVSFDHVNIAKTYGHTIDWTYDDITDVETITAVSILREHCETSLDEKLKQLQSCSNKHMENYEPESNVSVFFRLTSQICKGVQYLHENCKFVHFGLKLENILIEQDTVKIADAGLLGKDMIKKDNSRQSQVYKAPEVWTQTYANQSFEVDIYSLGVIIWEIFFAKRASTSLNKVSDVKKFVLNGNRPVLESTEPIIELEGLIDICWQQDPAKRLPIGDVVLALDTLIYSYKKKSGMMDD